MTPRYGPGWLPSAQTGRLEGKTLRLGDIAPDFTAQSTRGEISFHEWLGDGWGVLFSHPADFTPVCTTELDTVARLKPEFDRRDVKVIGLSVDSVQSHERWEGDIGEVQGTPMNFPIIADTDQKTSRLYDLIDPMSTGRNFAEILRAIDSLQLTAALPVATPADWVPGHDVIVGLAVDDDAAKERFGELRIVKPYLRCTGDPSAKA